MSSGPFNCIFCTESFDSRETLQVHFRKHGDPNLHAKLKTSKKRVPGAVVVDGASGFGAAAAAGSEDVSCDVCSEQFPSVARAITHKHKFHRDHSVKNFCPWCGKLFPIKHLLDKHIVVHASQERSAECERFACDECQFEFYSCAAVSYHNRSFHRADAPAPGVLPVAGSRNYRLLNKELVQVFYCHLCGGEYINSFNLQKHISEQHTGPEWLELPEEVLRCPRCDATFHSPAAYSAHLTHHSPHDIYTHPHENLPDITEFTIETVPPIIEKMEVPEQMDIDQMLAVDLELSSSHGSQEVSNPPLEADSSRDKKNKNGPAPRKAITLNQFLSMNKDVFGDVFNCHGVEEVPSQMVAQQLRPKRPPQKRPQPVIKPGTKVMSMDNLQRLKQQGVVVQVKASNQKPVQVGNKVNTSNGVAVGRVIKIAAGATQQSKPGTIQQAKTAMGVQQIKVATSVGQQPKLAASVGQQPKVATSVGQQLKVATTVGQLPKVAPSVGQQPKIATSVGQLPKIAQTVGQQPKIATSLGQQPKIAMSVGQQPKIATSVGQQPKVTTSISQGPRVATGVSLQPKVTPGVQQQAQRFGQPVRPMLKKVMRPPAPRQPGPPAPPAPPASKPLKMSPSLSRPPGRPGPGSKPADADAATPGPFSCFKKPKESLIPISDVPGIAELLRPEPAVSTAAQSTKVNLTTSISSMKSSAAIATATKPSPGVAQPERPSQEVNRNKHKSLPLEALEKLKKQGLLVKKPKLDNEGSSEAPTTSDAPCLTVKSGG